jgi:hypothetical protein
MKLLEKDILLFEESQSLLSCVVMDIYTSEKSSLDDLKQITVLFDSDRFRKNIVEECPYAKKSGIIVTLRLDRERLKKTLPPSLRCSAPGEGDAHFQAEGDAHFQAEGDAHFQAESDAHFKAESDAHFQRWRLARFSLYLTDPAYGSEDISNKILSNILKFHIYHDLTKWNNGFFILLKKIIKDEFSHEPNGYFRVVIPEVLKKLNGLENIHTFKRINFVGASMAAFMLIRNVEVCMLETEKYLPYINFVRVLALGATLTLCPRIYREEIKEIVKRARKNPKLGLQVVFDNTSSDSRSRNIAREIWGEELNFKCANTHHLYLYKKFCSGCMDKEWDKENDSEICIFECSKP